MFDSSAAFCSFSAAEGSTSSSPATRASSAVESVWIAFHAAVELDSFDAVLLNVALNASNHLDRAASAFVSLNASATTLLLLLGSFQVMDG